MAVDDARCEALDREVVAGRNRPLVVDWLAERIHHAADHGVADRHAQDLARPLDLIALAQVGVVAKQHRAYLVLFEVHGQASDVVRELEKLAVHHLIQAVESRDSVAEGQYRAYLVDLDLRVVVLNLLPQQLGYFICLNLSHSSLSQLISSVSVRGGLCLNV